MRAAGALVAVLLLAGCRGPEPHVARQDVAPAQDGRALRVEALVENRGGGSGQVGLTATVRERGSGTVVGRAEKELELLAHERHQVAIDVPLAGVPTPLDPARLDVSVEAQYPIE